MSGGKSRLYLMRGIPGSGKTTWANEIRGNDFDVTSPTYCSADEIMWERYNRFRADKLPEIHSACMSLCFSAMETGRDVIVDNTNLSPWEWEPYALAAKLAGYEVHLLECKVCTAAEVQACLARQSFPDGSTIPEDVFQRMVGRYFLQPGVRLSLIDHYVPRRVSHHISGWLVYSLATDSLLTSDLFESYEDAVESFGDLPDVLVLPLELPTDSDD